MAASTHAQVEAPSNTESSDRSAKLSLSTRLSFGFGSTAVAVKNAAFGYLLLYYNQVIGVPAAIVSTAIALTLIIDAVVDPLLGRWSDVTRSRLGRRHPFIFSAALPTGLFFALVWFPPTGLSHVQMGIWIFVMASLARAAISAYEIPSTAMVSELTTDYTQRTRLFSLRFWFGYAGTFAFIAFSLSVFFVATERYPVGQLNPEGYKWFVLTGALMMMLAILVCGLGTMRQIPNMRQASAGRPKQALAGHLREMFAAFRNRSFLAIFGFGVFKFTAIGLAGATSLYFSTYIFDLGAKQIAILSLEALVAATIAAPLAPRLSRRMGKRNTSMLMAVLGICVAVSPMTLAYFGLFLEPGDPSLVPALFLIGTLGNALIAISLINTSSMLADVVEDHAVSSGQHQAGVFFSASGFMQQCSAALGVFAAGMVLTWSEFPEKANPASVTQAMEQSLLAHYIPTVVALWTVGCLILLFYDIDAKRHGSNVARLRAREAHAADVDAIESGVPPIA